MAQSRSRGVAVDPFSHVDALRHGVDIYVETALCERWFGFKDRSCPTQAFDEKILRVFGARGLLQAGLREHSEIDEEGCDRECCRYQAVAGWMEAV